MNARQKLTAVVSVMATALAVVYLPSMHPSKAQNSLASKPINQQFQTNRPKHQTLSSAARHSRFALERGMGGEDLPAFLNRRAKSKLDVGSNFTQSGTTLAGGAKRANKDYNQYPQNETSIALWPGSGPGVGNSQYAIGANDYGVNVPIASGAYNSEGVTYMPPFPILAAFDGTNFVHFEVPIGGGDPSLASGYTRAAPGVPAGLPVVYYGSLAFSASYAENGIIVQRSFNNGQDWSEADIPALVPPNGIGVPAYWDQAFDPSVFNDKEYLAVDNTGGPHNGRVYVTWTQFTFTATTARAPIMLAYSDDNAITFSTPIEVGGRSATLCPGTFDGSPGDCDFNQASVPSVAPDGTVVVGFMNFNNETAPEFRDQYLVTRVNPDTFTVSGPSKVAILFNGANDFPFSRVGDLTLCNSNFRADLMGGNIAVDSAGTVYATWWDDQAQAGQFPFRTVVGPRSTGYRCPGGKNTDADVYFSRSTDGGVTWSAPVNLLGRSSGGDQWYPWVATGPANRVSVVFFDRRNDPNNKLAETTVAKSTDGGRTFQLVTVSDFASNFDDAFFGGGDFIGDYNGMAMDASGRSYPVWTGVIPGKTDSDVFTTIVNR